MTRTIISAGMIDHCIVAIYLPAVNVAEHAVARIEGRSSGPSYPERPHLNRSCIGKDV
ncbi:hypothetical protein SERLA73DRAFT_148149, partial [Serpula lacrymans var. lacrymans S7.3]